MHTDEAGSARSRLVLVGASNLTRYLPTALSLARGALPGPLEVLAAHGLGRSYGAWSRVLARELPGISECGLWNALDASDRRAGRPTYALCTDIGNDLVYGSEPAVIVRWVERCLDRLAPSRATVALTLLPVATLRELSPARYELVRRVFFPSHHIDLETVRGRALELQERLLALGHDRGLTLVPAPPQWYGLDPIHVRPARRHEAWRAILGAWGLRSEAQRPLGLGEVVRVRLARPVLRRVLGRERSRAQPAAILRDGSALSLY